MKGKLGTERKTRNWKENWKSKNWNKN